MTDQHDSEPDSPSTPPLDDEADISSELAAEIDSEAPTLELLASELPTTAMRTLSPDDLAAAVRRQKRS